MLVHPDTHMQVSRDRLERLTQEAHVEFRTPGAATRKAGTQHRTEQRVGRLRMRRRAASAET
jgi:hypothetical protein